MGFLKVQNWLKIKKSQAYTKLLKKDFGSMGKASLIIPPYHSYDSSEIYVGCNCSISSGTWLDVVKEYGGVKYNPRIDIGDNTYIGRNAHIIACDHMRIGKHAVFADGVYITDNFHGFENIDIPILQSPLVSRGPVVIEDEVWLGERVCVMPNVTIGKHSVVGSHSVVTKNIPPYSVAVGSPAKIIKRYDVDSKTWIKED